MKVFMTDADYGRTVVFIHAESKEEAWKHVEKYLKDECDMDEKEWGFYRKEVKMKEIKSRIISSIGAER